MQQPKGTGRKSSKGDATKVSTDTHVSNLELGMDLPDFNLGFAGGFARGGKRGTPRATPHKPRFAPKKPPLKVSLRGSKTKPTLQPLQNAPSNPAIDADDPVMTSPTKPRRNSLQPIKSPGPLGEGGTKSKMASKPSQGFKQQKSSNATLKNTSTSSLKSSDKTSCGGYERLVMGYIDGIPDQKVAVVRIFLSSTFSDFKAERNILAREAYPKLKTLCAEEGLDFEVMDLRWGITAEATNDHSVQKICMQEIKNCQKLSQGPNFVLLAGNRYGYRPLQSEVCANEFEMLFKIAEESQLLGTDLLRDWYQRDDNCVPPIYALYPIRDKLPHFGDHINSSEEEQHEASASWDEQQRTMHRCLYEAVAIARDRGLMSEAEAKKYSWSVTEEECNVGIMENSKPDSTSLVFIREFNDVSLDPNNMQCKRHFDTKPDGDTLAFNVEVGELKSRNKERIKETLNLTNVHEYSVTWRGEGIVPADAAHQEYLTKFCQDFVESISGLVKAHCKVMSDEERKECAYQVHVEPVRRGQHDEGVSQDGATGSSGMMTFDMFSGAMDLKNIIYEHQAAETLDNIALGSDPDRPKLHAEISHHAHLCQTRWQTFSGRHSELSKVQKYITADGPGKPYFIYAASGSGKTALMAAVASKTKSWISKPCVTVLRFLGTTPSSSTLHKTLVSICKQICLAYGELLNRNELKQLSSTKKYFTNLVIYVSGKYGANRPLCLILDSVDQLSGTGGAYAMKWLPRICPVHVKIVVSFIPNIGYCLDNAKKHITDETCFMELPKPNNETYNEIYDNFFKCNNKVLTDGQLQFMMQKASGIECNPLLLKLWLDDMLSWRSHMEVSQLTLLPTIKEAITHLFRKLEAKYGEKFISATLGYITLCKNGISGTELEDVLSCNDAVLNDVYRYHDPPIDGVIRIPPLMWARTRFDLKEYVVDRLTHTRTTLGWYHKQFIEAALERYCGEAVIKSLHKDLADLFLTEGKYERTIVLKSRGKTIENADRLVTPHPLVPSNTRKLVGSFYHLTEACNLDTIGEYLFSDLRYVICLASALATPKYSQNVTDILEYFQGDVMKAIKSALLQTLPYVIKDATALPVSLMGKMLPFKQSTSFVQKMYQEIEDYLHKCLKSSLVPITPVTQSAKVGLSWTSQGIGKVLAVHTDQKRLVVKGSAKSTVLCQIFNTERTTIDMTLNRPKVLESNKVISAAFSHMGDRVFLLCEKHLVVWSYSSGEVFYESNNVSRKGVLDNYLLVSPDDRYVVLAGKDRLAMFEQADNCYKVKRAIDLTGCKSTTDVQFSDLGEFTISCHVIKGKAQTFSAMVCWDFWNGKLASRVALPGLVSPGCMYKLPGYGERDIMLCACNGGKIVVVNMLEGKIIKEVANANLTGNLLSAFDSNNSVLAIAPKGNQSIKAYDVMNGSNVFSVETASPITTIEFSADATKLLAATETGYLVVIETEGGDTLINVLCHEDPLKQICVLDEDRLVTCSKACLYGWNVEDMMNTATEKSTGKEDLLHLQHIKSCVVNGDGRLVITCSDQRGVRIWLSSDGGHVTTIIHDHIVTSLHAAGQDSNHVIAVAKGGKILFSWNISSQELSTVDIDGEPVTCVCTGPNDTMAVICKSNIQVMNIHDFRVAKMVRTDLRDVKSASLNFAGSHLLVLSDVDSEDMCQAYKASVVTLDSGKVKTLDDVIYSSCVLQSGAMLLGTQQKVLLFRHDKEDFTPICEAKGKHANGAVTCVVTSLDNTFLMTGNSKGFVTLWNVPNTSNFCSVTMARSEMTHKSTVLCAAFSSTNRHLATGSRDGSISVLDTTNGAPLAMVRIGYPVTHLQLLPSSGSLLVAIKDIDSLNISIWKSIKFSFTEETPR